jgi:hypothetical protein
MPINCENQIEMLRHNGCHILGLWATWAQLSLFGTKGHMMPHVLGSMCMFTPVIYMCPQCTNMIAMALAYMRSAESDGAGYPDLLS